VQNDTGRIGFRTFPIVMPAKAGIQYGRPSQSLFAIGPERLVREERKSETSWTPAPELVEGRGGDDPKRLT